MCLDIKLRVQFNIATAPAFHFSRMTTLLDSFWLSSWPHFDRMLISRHDLLLPWPSEELYCALADNNAKPRKTDIIEPISWVKSIFSRRKCRPVIRSIRAESGCSLPSNKKAPDYKCELMLSLNFSLWMNNVDMVISSVNM